MREVSTIAAYRDRWHITSGRAIGTEADVSTIEQTGQRQRAQAAMKRAVAVSTAETDRQGGPGPEVEVEMQRGVER